MNNQFLNIYVKIQNLLNREDGQDLVEYALLITLVGLAAVSGMGSVASAINTVFGNISTTLGS
jgi:pilus assembly protein Flp/PilA